MDTTVDTSLIHAPSSAANLQHDARQSLRIAAHPAWTLLAMLATDLAALTGANVLTVLVRYAAGGQFIPAMYWRLWPMLLLCLVVFAAMRLYSGTLGPTEETRRVCLGIAGIYLFMGTVTFLFRSADEYSRAVFLVACVVSIVSVLGGRALVKALLSPRRWWGFPVLILGSGRSGRRLTRVMLSQPELGLKPVGMLDDRSWRRRGFRGVPLLGSTDLAVSLAQQHPQLRLVVVTAELSRQRLGELLLLEQQHIRHMIVIPDMHGVTSLGVNTYDLSGLLGLSVRHRLLDAKQVAFKRLIDMVLVLLLTPLLLPLVGILALLIKADSHGPVFFGHRRIGRRGKAFTCWKFRTMVEDAGEVLQQHLRDDPALAQEWERDKKLRNDPRITRQGRFLRRSSLDELPQFWNVVRGQMSLVGPRPIVEEERVRYGPGLALYTHVRPGITGLWQISGRNNLAYADRVRLDLYYVRNWSLWLDVHILSRTLLVVTLGKGAY